MLRFIPIIICIFLGEVCTYIKTHHRVFDSILWCTKQSREGALWLNVTDHTSEIKWAIIANRYIIAVLDVDRWKSGYSQYTTRVSSNMHTYIYAHYILYVFVNTNRILWTHWTAHIIYVHICKQAHVSLVAKVDRLYPGNNQQLLQFWFLKQATRFKIEYMTNAHMHARTDTNVYPQQHTQDTDMQS